MLGLHGKVDDNAYCRNTVDARSLLLWMPDA